MFSQTEKIIVAQEDAGTRIATWWKAGFLAPFWFYPLLPIFGSALHAVDLDGFGYVGFLVFFIGYFWLDLMSKKIVIDQSSMRNQLSRLSVSDIVSIDLSRGRWFGAKELRIRDRRNHTILLKHTRISADDIQTIVNTLQRMSPSCRIDPEVDALIRYKKVTLLPSLYDTSSTVYIPYHVDRAWEDLPGTFLRLLKGWSNFFGPVGVLIVFLPVSMWLFSIFYRMTFLNLDRYEQHETMYHALLEVAKWWFNVQGDACVSGFNLVARTHILEHPLILAGTVVGVAVTAQKILKASCGANRLTMNASEISLDHWEHSFSYKIRSTRWDQIKSLSVSSDKDKRRIKFCLHNGSSVKLDASGIDEQHKSRFLQSIKRFAPLCEIDAEVHEMLEPPTEKSYTQLWLQSITMAPQAKSLKPIEKGTLLEGGRYEIIRKLGVGGQGTAYLGYDLRDKEQKSAPRIALKEILMPPYLAGPLRKTMIERFYAEANLLKNIDSEHVVKLIDYFVDERGAYLVLEHIEGKTLRELVCESGALSEDQATRLVQQMLQILKILHTHQIVHRDFTPDNLILRPDGLLKLIDFNVAQEESEGTTATIVGKHAYVPPEQFRGKPCPQSDLYAFGATIFYLLTGCDPEPISQSKLPDNIAKQHQLLAQLIEHCTAVELNERAESVDQLFAHYPEILQPPTSISIGHDNVHAGETSVDVDCTVSAAKTLAAHALLKEQMATP